MQFQERKRWLFFGLPFTFTTYRVTEEYITVKSGLLRQKEDDCYMYKIVDTRLVRSLPERFFGLGTVECFGGDTTDPVLHLKHIRHSKEIKNFILAASEEQRTKKKTLQTQNIGDRGRGPATHGCGWRRDSGPSAGASLRSLRRQKNPLVPAEEDRQRIFLFYDWFGRMAGCQVADPEGRRLPPFFVEFCTCSKKSPASSHKGA